MGISGSQKALMYALSGVMRAGASRSGYTSGRVSALIGGVQRGAGKTVASYAVQNLSVSDIVDATPNTCTFLAKGFTPTVGQDAILTLGSVNNLNRLFAGVITLIDQSYVDAPVSPQWQVHAIDYTWLLNQRKVIKRYTSQSASLIAIDLITNFAPAGFTTRNVVLGLDTIDEITFTNQDLSEALTNLAKRIGAYWYIDYYKDLHFFETDVSVTNPTDLTATHASLSDFQVTRDLTQVVTRMYVEGGGSDTQSDCAIGETMIPVVDAAWYDPAGGTVVSGPQRITYTGVAVGGAGALVGPGAAPSVGPSAAAAAGTGLSAGTFQYAYTDVTAAGESLPSPLTVITLAATMPTPPAFGGNTNTAGNNLSVGTYKYAITNVNAAGETDPSPQATLITDGQIATPSTSPTPTTRPTSGSWGGSPGTYTLLYLYRNSDGSFHTALSTSGDSWFLSVGANYQNGIETGPCSSDSRVIAVDLYVQGTGYTKVGSATNVPGTNWSITFTYADSAGSAPTNNWVFRKPQLTSLPIGPPSTTLRHLWRTAVNGSQLKLLATLNLTDTTYTDTTPDASLGANAPTSNTASTLQVSLSAIAAGPSGTTDRKVYRTPVNGSQLKFLAAMGNNTATTLTDLTADGSLGANAPTSDTSGLSPGSGQIAVGSATLLTSNGGQFSTSGGWVVIGNGQQAIRYTGVSTNTLTGIPTIGIGSVTATVSYGSTLTASPALTGVPASGVGSIQYALLKGDHVNVLVQADDATGQSILASLVGGTGIQEDYIQDGRLSLTEATARAAAQLTLRGRIETSIAWKSRDHNTRAGSSITVNLGAPTNVTGTFKIQEVTSALFGEAISPTFTAKASTTRFSLEDLLRTVRKDAA